MQSDLTKIEELDRNDIAASKRQDKAALLDLWDEDGVALPPGGEPIVGIKALTHWLIRDDGPSHEVTVYEHDFHERTILGDWAFELGMFRSVARLTDSGETIETSGKLLRILKRQPDGEWKVARSIWNLDPAVNKTNDVERR